MVERSRCRSSVVKDIWHDAILIQTEIVGSGTRSLFTISPSPRRAPTGRGGPRVCVRLTSVVCAMAKTSVLSRMQRCRERPEGSGEPRLGRRTTDAGYRRRLHIKPASTRAAIAAVHISPFHSAIRPHAVVMSLVPARQRRRRQSPRPQHVRRWARWPRPAQAWTMRMLARCSSRCSDLEESYSGR